MKKILLMFVALLFMACSSDNETGVLDIVEGPEGAGDFEFTYFENSELVVVSNDDTYLQWANVQEGQKLVFQYHFVFDDEPMIADDEYDETIRFEVDSDVTTFSFETEELTGAKATFTKICFCYFPFEDDKNVSPTGKITGEKISENEWEVTLDVVFYGNEKRTFTATYVLDPLD